MYLGKNLASVAFELGLVMRLTMMNTGKLTNNPQIPAWMFIGFGQIKLNKATMTTPASIPLIAPAFVALGHAKTPSMHGNVCPINP